MFRLPMVSQLTADSAGAGVQPFAAMKKIVRMKPMTVAPMEMRLLVVLQRKVKSVITAVASSGRNKINQGSASNFIGENGNIELRTSNFEHRTPANAASSAFDVRCWMFDV